VLLVCCRQTSVNLSLKFPVTIYVGFHRMGGWVDPGGGLDILEEYLARAENRTLDRPPTRIT